MHVNCVHLKLRPFQCDSCEASFGQKEHLKIHKQSIHEKITFPCEICEKEFSSKMNLNKHIKRVHKKEKKFTCNRCHMRFCSNTELILHTNAKHSNHKPFSCVHCEQDFPNKGHITQHLNQPKDIRCKICNDSFHCFNQLRNHQTSVHGKKRFQCKKCDKTLSSKYILKYHVAKFHMK